LFIVGDIVQRVLIVVRADNHEIGPRQHDYEFDYRS
jgi:hypothetical protein